RRRAQRWHPGPDGGVGGGLQPSFARVLVADVHREGGQAEQRHPQGSDDDRDRAALGVASTNSESSLCFHSITVALVFDQSPTNTVFRSVQVFPLNPGTRMTG